MLSRKACRRRGIAQKFQVCVTRLWVFETCLIQRTVTSYLLVDSTYKAIEVVLQRTQPRRDNDGFELDKIRAIIMD